MTRFQLAAVWFAGGASVGGIVNHVTGRAELGAFFLILAATVAVLLDAWLRRGWWS